MAKKRLDLLIQEKYPNLSRNQIQSFIMQGYVTVDDQIISKAGTLVDEKSNINLKVMEPKYVSRAGYKLERALEVFKINPQGLIALDAGISTGGFTDCLLQRGVSKVYGIDVGYGQVHQKIAIDPRVILMEKTNLRFLKDLPEKVDLVTLDLSFISLTKVIDTVYSLLKDTGHLIALIKPQFEAEKGAVPKGGVIKDETLVAQIVDNVIQKIEAKNFILLGLTESPILGTMGNKEFLAYFQKKLD